MDILVYENVALALVREFLKRKGFAATYQTLEEECPKTNSSISNRNDLAKILHFDRILKKNKHDMHPLKTILEIISRSLMEQTIVVEQSHSAERTTHSSNSNTKSNHNDVMVTEVDLETELMIGRGREDIMEKGSRADLDIHPQYCHKKHRKNSSRIYQQTLIEQSDELNRDLRLKSQSDYMAGSVDGLSKHTNNVNHHTGSPADQSAGARSDGPISETSLEKSSDQHSSDAASLASDTPPPLLDAGGAPDPDPPVFNGAEASEARGTDHGEEAKPTPRPEPPREKPKTDLEKSIELLRARRLTMQSKIARSLEDPSSNSDPVAEPEPIAIPTHVMSEPEPQSAESEEGEPIELEDDDHSFSPRVICDPLVDEIPDELPPPDSVMPHKHRKPEPPTTYSKQRIVYQEVKPVIASAKPIDIHTAMNLKSLLFGSASALIPESWSCLSLSFCDLPGTRFGLVQPTVGPEGVISSVQAYFLLHLLYLDQQGEDWKTDRKLSPPARDRSRLLASAIGSILWNAGGGKCAVLALPSQSAVLSGGGRFKADGITETGNMMTTFGLLLQLMINTFDKVADLNIALDKFLPYFEDDDSPGVVLLVMSAILSRGIDLVLDDMASPDNSLIVSNSRRHETTPDHIVHSTSRELVHLLLCGRATSYAHNDCIEVVTGIGQRQELRGIPSRNDIGLLSLTEHTNLKYQVGTFLKTPKYPVWLIETDLNGIMSYSLVFCINKDLVSDWKVERRFYLFYHDSQTEVETPIRLTIDTTSSFFEPPENDDEVPILDLCLRTKWKDAQIDWNGAKPKYLPSKSDAFLDDFLLD